jgi:hypothetical protein
VEHFTNTFRNPFALTRGSSGQIPFILRKRGVVAPTRRIEEGAASLRLAEAYLKARLVPPPRRNDARHIALATVADLDAIVSWNFRDMVNIRKKKIVHSVNAKFGYRLIDIISPLEVPRD